MIRNVNSNDLNEIAKLHMESFEDHFLPKLGLKLLAKYYKEFINKKNIFIANVNENNKIDGLLLGTPNSEKYRNLFVRNNIIGLSFRISLLCLKLDYDTWTRVFGCFRTVFHKKNKRVRTSSKNDIKPFCLLSICVSQDSKGKGVSKDLIEAFEKKLVNQGYRSYALTVHKNNNRANHFYKKQGMHIYKESESEYGYMKQLVNNQNMTTSL